MNRRTFLKQAGLLATSTLASPYILPSGRLFAATGNRIANHVVLCLFAGGVRNLESMHQKEGNLMPYTLGGTPKVNSPIQAGMSPLPMPQGAPLRKSGTLYKEFRFAQGPTAHISAHLTAITGQYNLGGISTKQRPPFPTVFEYYRKHFFGEKHALNAWWVTDRADPYFYFNFSQHTSYGAKYGANFIQPLSVLSRSGSGALGNPRTFCQQEVDQIKQLRDFFDQNFEHQEATSTHTLQNLPKDTFAIENFINQCVNDAVDGKYDDPWGLGQSMNNDMYNICFTEALIRNFQPELLVVNMFEIDRGHTDFTLYCDNIRKADYALAHLWRTIQSTPGMANDTILIAAPEHGRNLKPNTLVDAYGRYALDHTSDPTSREIFALVLGPADKINQDKVVTEVTGESVDIVPTIARILGFSDEIWGKIGGKTLEEAFV